MDAPIYLDHHATTPLDPRVLEAMMPYLTSRFGNAASRTHSYGWEAEHAIDVSRERLAAAVGASPRDIVFTSGATEANNLALFGIARGTPGAVAAPVTEHKAILDVLTALESEGTRVHRLEVEPDGLVSRRAVTEALGAGLALLSVMHANNEIGVIQPISALASEAHAAGALFHTDAAQSLGKLPLHAEEMGLDLVSLSAHKVYGPKGIGALVVRRSARQRIRPLQYGGGHEGGLRSGTLPVALIVGFAEAVALAVAEREAEATRLATLRDHLYARLVTTLPAVVLNGHPVHRLPGNLNISIDFVEADALLTMMPGVALSTGSACTSESDEPSYVLVAIGRRGTEARTALRFGLGRDTTRAEVDEAADAVVAAVQRLRSLSPRWAERRPDA